MPSKQCKVIEHRIQLQLYSNLTWPVDNTQFWVTLKIIKTDSKVEIFFPTINFQTGPYTNDNNSTTLPEGGVIRTVSGYLPKDLRPSDPVYRSSVVAANDGFSTPFTYIPPDFPAPLTGYILSVTFYGGIVISAAGIFNNVIPPGNHTMMPTSISYLVQKREKLCKNFVISSGPTNITQFQPGGNSANTALRDTHVNDAYNGILAWSWSDNSNIDQTNGIVNAWVRIGRVNKGNPVLLPPVQLTNLTQPDPANQQPGVFDTAVTINRFNSNNIVVSYGYYYSAYEQGPGINDEFLTCRAISYDGGYTWPDSPYDGTNLIPDSSNNGYVYVQPGLDKDGTVPEFGDCPGVRSDKYGNIWYAATAPYEYINGVLTESYRPYFSISTNNGYSFTIVYAAPLPTSINSFYDSPQYCFGGNGQGQYGLWFEVSYQEEETTSHDLIAKQSGFGFIPIYGPGQYGTGNTVILSTLPDVIELPSITASQDGRVWVSSNIPAHQAISAYTVVYKSPGPLADNYAGPWQVSMYNKNGYVYGLWQSYPESGYFTSTQTAIYDDVRQALYVLFCQCFPDFAGDNVSQNMRLYLVISRDNGQTFSDPIDIANTHINNRGFQSMALDTTTGDLVFGWYDGRNDPLQQQIEYYGAILSSKTLDKLVKKIPFSNPLYNTGSAVDPIVSSAVKATVPTKPGKPLRRRREGKHKNGLAEEQETKPQETELPEAKEEEITQTQTQKAQESPIIV